LFFQIPESYAISAGQPTNVVSGLGATVPAGAMPHKSTEINEDKLLPMLPMAMYRLFQDTP
jgi:hypothetical protein